MEVGPHHAVVQWQHCARRQSQGTGSSLQHQSLAVEQFDHRAASLVRAQGGLGDQGQHLRQVQLHRRHFLLDLNDVGMHLRVLQGIGFNLLLRAQVGHSAHDAQCRALFVAEDKTPVLHPHVTAIQTTEPVL